MPPAPLSVGAPRWDEYDFFGVAGRGANSVVYKAIHRSMQRVVAIKTLSPLSPGSPETLRRFSREARATAAMDHPNIVKIFSSGVSPDGQPYLVMQYLEGRTLAEIIAEGGPLSLPSFVTIFSAVLDALDHAHRQGIIHRDLKPGNIMILDDPSGFLSVKVVDFGIAKLMPKNFAGLSAESLTQPGAMLGSPAYMSPEQCTNGLLDARSDIYALGCVMFEALSGKPPLCGATALETMFKQLTAEPPTVAAARPELSLPPALVDLIAMALAKAPAARQQTVAQMKAQFAEAISQKERKQTYNLRAAVVAPAKQLWRKKTGLRSSLAAFLAPALCFLLIAVLILIGCQYRNRTSSDSDRYATLLATKFISAGSGDLRHGRAPQAIYHYRLAQEALRDHSAPLLMCKSWLALGIACNQASRLMESEKYLRTAIKLGGTLPDWDKLDTLETQYQLAYSLALQSRMKEAEILCLQVLKKRRQLLGKGCRAAIEPSQLLEYIYLEENKLAEAENICRELIAMDYNVHGPLDNSTLWMEYQLARVLSKQGRKPEMAVLLRSVKNRMRETTVLEPTEKKILTNGIAALLRSN